MNGRRWTWPLRLLTGLGVGLFSVAAIYHGLEFYELNSLLGPLVALCLDGSSALLVVYAGFWLAGAKLDPEYHRTIVLWALGGGAIFLVVIGATFLVRAIEGRAIAEPFFPLLIAADIGILAGTVAGYYYTEVQARTRETRSMNEALLFVNDLLRHDLRNDLTVMQGYADLLARDEEPASQRENATIVADKADEALGRLETSQAVTDAVLGEAELGPVDLVGLAAELAARTEATFDVAVTTDLPDHAYVMANDGLRSVVDNLLENAAEHNDADQPAIAISATREPDPELVRLTICDNGPGIPDERKSRLLDRTSPAPSHGGLAMAQTLVESYGGSIRIEDNEPRGSLIVVELPRANDGEVPGAN